MSPYRGGAAALLALTLAAAPAAAQSPSSLSAERAIRRLERAWLDAYERRDAASMDTIVHADFAITFPNGSGQTKQQLMASLRRPRRGPVPRFSTEDVKARVYGSTVILTGIVSERTDSTEARYRYTDTYIRSGRRWQVVASHLSDVARAPMARPQGISLLGDTLRAFPLSAETRARYEAQLATARAAYDRTPTNADSIVWLGRRLAYLGRVREAIQAYSTGIRLHPDNAWLYRHRGHRYITLRDLDRAIGDFERATALVAGKPDEIEPDGQPNARNMPIGTLHSNIAYHLGLAHYLKGDFARAVPVYQREMEHATNDDRRVSTAHWLYMSLRRLGRNAEAAEVLRPIRREMEVIENDAYHRLLLLYKGELSADSVLAVTPSGEMSVADATAAYGIGNWHLYNGRRADAERIFRRIIAGGQWPAFGYIAAEAELARMR